LVFKNFVSIVGIRRDKISENAYAVVYPDASIAEDTNSVAQICKKVSQTVGTIFRKEAILWVARGHISWKVCERIVYET
jgi:hypothetical protein